MSSSSSTLMEQPSTPTEKPVSSAEASSTPLLQPTIPASGTLSAVQCNKDRSENFAHSGACNKHPSRECKLLQEQWSTAKYFEWVPFDAPILQDGTLSVFLAGSIDMGNAANWQPDVREDFGDMVKKEGIDGERIHMCNPRFGDWTADVPKEDIEKNLVKQIDWELDALERVDIILMNIENGSSSPISLLELGIHSHSKKILVRCGKEFYRKTNVRKSCERYGVPFFEEWDDFYRALDEKIVTVKRAKQITKILTETETKIADILSKSKHEVAVRLVKRDRKKPLTEMPTETKEKTANIIFISKDDVVGMLSEQHQRIVKGMPDFDRATIN